MSTQQQSTWITFNGEIYNYLELREELQALGYKFSSGSDTEVILNAYEAWGPRCVERFNGMWAFAIFDVRSRRLFCSRDRFGIKPFHFHFDGGRLLFASEIKQILAFKSVARKANSQAVYEYLLHGSFDHAADTFFQGISRLAPGHNLILDLDSSVLSVVRYYSPVIAINRSISPQKAASEFHRLFTDSVRLQLRSDVEVGSCLSGGLDSSSIVCTAHRLLTDLSKNSVQRTFSSHFDDPEANELEYMRTVIDTTGVRASFTYPTAKELLTELDRLVWHQEEPFGSTSLFAQWSVFKLVAHEGVKVMLDGQGADEQLAGYVSFSLYYFAELLRKRSLLSLVRESWRHSRLQKVPLLPLWRSAVALNSRQLLGAKSAEPPEWMNRAFAAAHAQSDLYETYSRLAPFGTQEELNNLLFQMTFHNNLPSLLRYEDRNSMAFSVEARVPFLDHRLVEFVFSLPSSLKIRAGYTKWVLRKAMTGIIPEKIRLRVSKLGFATPERKWQQTSLRPLLAEALASDRLKGIINSEAAERYFQGVTVQGIKDFTPWRWINLYLWGRAFDVA